MLQTMDKFAVDLDSILDKLEENDDDTERGRPPSLVKITNNNTFGYNNSNTSNNNNNNFLLYQSSNDDNTTQLAINDDMTCSTSSTFVANNPFTRTILSSYLENQTLDQLDLSDADFGISVKQSEINNYDCHHNERESFYDKDVNQSIDKNQLMSSLLEKAMWNTDNNNEDIDNDCSNDLNDGTQDVLNIDNDSVNVENSVTNDATNCKMIVNYVNDLTNLGDLNSEQQNNDEKEMLSEMSEITVKLLDNITQVIDKDTENNKSDLKSLVEIENQLESTINADNVESTNDLAIDLQTNDHLIRNPVDSELIKIEQQINEKTDDNIINEDQWESNSLKNNFDENTEVVKFNEIEVNIDELTEHEINEYLNEFDDEEENCTINVTNINTNIDIDKSCDLSNNELLNATLDKDISNSLSQSTSSVSIEDNDKVSDISDFDGNTIASSVSPINSSVTNNNINLIEEFPTKISRPNTLPITSNVLTVNEVMNGNNNGYNSNDDEINDNNNNTSDNNNVPNDDELQTHNLPNDDFYDQNLTLGLTEDEQMLGKVKPFWIPDNETQMCMHCDIKFSLIKRRHHCRACGKVLCAQCCNSRAKLLYLDCEVSRVCQICYSVLAKIAAIERNANELNQSSTSTLRPDNVYPTSSSDSSMTTTRCPDPSNPLEYCSTIPPLQQEQDVLNRMPPTVMVPIGVLKRGDRPKGEPKQVVFSDGIRPGGDLTETGEGTSSLAFLRRAGRIQHKLKSPPVENTFQLLTTSSKSKASRIIISDSTGNLPPIINYYDLNVNKSIKNKPTILNLIDFLRDPSLPPVVFAMTKNLHIFAKIVNKKCCVKSEIWNFATKGMATIGQDEILMNLEQLADEDTFPRDIFRFFTTIFDNVTKGTVYNDLNHIFFPDGLFGFKDNSGFLFTRPTLQCFSNMVLPTPPFLLAILIHKWEIPWAKVFPIRLLLRLGAEYKFYPSPIVSYRCRKPVYCEIGHTIMNVLADFRNFQYTLQTIPGLTIHLEDKKITIHLPRNRYEKVQRLVTSSNEHVLSFGANFSLKADSHLVCMQNDVDGQYQTQSINIEGASRRITGASFIVFSGALKSSTGLTAKMSIVEDGLLVQIPPNTMIEMRNYLKDMKDYDINCGKIDSQPEEVIHMLWTDEDMSVNLGVRSPIDATNLEGIQSIRIYNGTDYTNNKLIIRWTEVFFLQLNEMNRRNDSLDTSRLAEMIAQAFCVALISYLDQLFDNGFTKIGLRINLDSDKVGYEVGSNGISLPPQYTSELDGALIPIIMDNISSGIEDQLIMELLFHILVK
ncbi:zinc finger FYVE domain-containing protein 9-like [Oppia nitens]|uniref:zinc finger FYVE domain-containing protein 9-like n=1 Tax=Oppia nitens TaxID=1686743 RepID=UPI0023DA11B4|nr:zinc finger FYVE domain-containing protein 9-like [Oppia nitens]